MREYLMTLVCGAFLCALVRSIGGDGSGKGTRDLLCGIFLALLAISPLRSIELPYLDLSAIERSAEVAARAGEEQAEEAMADIISRDCEAYICSRAEDMGLNITAEVTLNSEQLPESVTITGYWTDLQRQNLTNLITLELGIQEEGQVWKRMQQNRE